MLAILLWLIEKVDLEHTLVAVAHNDVAHPYVLNDAASAVAGLDADYTVQLGAVHVAILNPEVLEAA